MSHCRHCHFILKAITHLQFDHFEVWVCQSVFTGLLINPAHILVASVIAGRHGVCFLFINVLINSNIDYLLATTFRTKWVDQSNWTSLLLLKKESPIILSHTTKLFRIQSPWLTQSFIETGTVHNGHKYKPFNCRVKEQCLLKEAISPANTSS